MKIVTLKLVLLCGAIAISGCTSRFIDDFEVDTVGAAPDVAPDGAPDDQVFVLPQSGSVTVTASGPIAGSQSLRIAGPRGSFSPTAFMYAEEISDSSERVYAQWSGRLSSDASATVRFFAGHFSSIVEVVLEDGTIEVNGAVAGTYTPGAVHTILLNADPSTDTFGMSAVGAVSAGADQSGPVLNSGTFPQNNIGLTFELSEGGTNATYVVDTVRMSERNP